MVLTFSFQLIVGKNRDDNILFSYLFAYLVFYVCVMLMLINDKKKLNYQAFSLSYYYNRFDAIIPNVLNVFLA